MRFVPPFDALSAGKELSGRYELPKRAEQLQKLLRRAPEKVEWVLRSHIGAPVYHDDALERDNLDEYLAGLSLVHIIGYPAEEYEALGLDRDMVSWQLDNRSVRRFFEKHYPTAVSVLLRAQLTGELRESYLHQLWAEQHRSEWADCVRQFLALDATFLIPGAMNDFVSLLDDYRVHHLWRSDLKWALEKPKRLAAFLEDPNGRQLIEGMQAFFEFSDDLDDLLGSMNEIPMTRGLMWLHFGYWYGAGGERMRDVAEWVEQCIEHTTDAEARLDAFDLRAAFERLTDFGGYPAKLLQSNHDVLARWLKHANVRG